MLDDNLPPIGEDPGSFPSPRVRRSIFIPQELEASLSRLAEERGTTTNDLIAELLTRAVDALEEQPPSDTEA